ncbi:hypothetical protein AAFF_G00304860 [Aldrovandia affinis]|uniref:Uncharacterized protein n=1 Tax=Aldrovandia affinis TaxID=143900 RepID=A0AAD7SPH2_9TELE|nr:hypothetical protein AAFF_G00304860 [Aldrovandia affinis]
MCVGVTAEGRSETGSPGRTGLDYRQGLIYDHPGQGCTPPAQTESGEGLRLRTGRFKRGLERRAKEVRRYRRTSTLSPATELRQSTRCRAVSGTSDVTLPASTMKVPLQLVSGAWLQRQGAGESVATVVAIALVPH